MIEIGLLQTKFTSTPNKRNNEKLCCQKYQSFKRIPHSSLKKREIEQIPSTGIKLHTLNVIAIAHTSKQIPFHQTESEYRVSQRKLHYITFTSKKGLPLSHIVFGSVSHPHFISTIGPHLG